MPAAALLDELRSSTVLIIAVLIFIVLMVYRRPLGDALSRLSHLKVKRGETEVMAIAGDSGPVADQPPSGEQSPDETPSPEELVGDSAEVPDDKRPDDDPEALRAEMISLLFDRREDEAEKVLIKLQELEPDAKQRKGDRVRWESVRFMKGLAGSSALDSLRRMAEDEEIKAFALLFVGHSLAHVGQLGDAVDAYLESAEAATAALPRAEAISLAATTQAKAGQGQDALVRLKDALRDTQDDEALFSLWTGLAEVYELLENEELRAIALQKAAELRPNDSKVRFRAAWAYSEADSALAPLVAHHYQALLGVSPDYAIAINNFGVQLERLEMPIHAVELYEAAAEKNNTLAMANLAYQLMGSGFADQAEALLEKASGQPNPHENVASATASLAQRKEKERDKKRDLLALGQQLAEFVRIYASAMIEDAPKLQGDGNWTWEDGKEATVSKAGEKLTVEWEVGTTKHQLTAELQGRAARGQFRKQSESDYWMSKLAEAFLVVAPTGDSMQVARLDSDGMSTLTLRSHGG